MKLTNGTLLFSIGVIHNLFGIVVGSGVAGPDAFGGRNLFAEVARAGVIGAIERDQVRTLLFWFLFFGWMLLLVAQLVHAAERAGRPVGRGFALHLAALGLAGGVLIPISGFWLVLPVAGRIYRAAPAQLPAQPDRPAIQASISAAP